MVAACAVAIIVWGALAFGGVYAWAYTPLLIACVVVGAVGLLRRGPPVAKAHRAAFVALSLLLAAVILQLVPLPVGLLRSLSPSADRFLQNYDMAYALGLGRHPLSINPRATMLGAAFLAAFVVFLAGLVRAFSMSGVRPVAGAIVVFGLLLALIGIGQKSLIGDHAYGGMKIYGLWAPEAKLSTPFGPFVNKNHFAGWMLMALPLALGLALGTAERGLRHVSGGWRSTLLWLSSPGGGRLQLLLLAVLIMGASLLLTRSRSGLGCLVIALMLASIAARRRFASRHARLAAVGSLVIVFAVVLAWAGGDLAARVTSQMDSVELRQRIWSDSAAIIRDFPLAGTGLNTFGTAMLSYQTSNRDLHFQETHNDYLQILVEGGLLLALPTLVAIAMVARSIRRRFASGHDDTMTYWVRVGATTGIVAIAVQSFVEFSLQMPGNAALCVVLMAIALHEPRGRTARPAPASGPHP